jgi:serine/threonine protein kinase
VDSEESVIHYCKGELLGHGAYGRVYQGLDTATGQLLAIKTIQVITLNINLDGSSL